MEEEEEVDEEGMDSDEDSPVKNKSAAKLKSGDISFSKVTDFHKLTEGMDDLGMSEEEDGESGEEDDEDSSEGEEDDEEEDDDDDVDDDVEDDDAVMTFSKEKVDEEVEKGMCVKNQLGMFYSFFLSFNLTTVTFSFVRQMDRTQKRTYLPRRKLVSSTLYTT